MKTKRQRSVPPASIASIPLSVIDSFYNPSLYCSYLYYPSLDYPYISHSSLLSRPTAQYPFLYSTVSSLALLFLSFCISLTIILLSIFLPLYIIPLSVVPPLLSSAAFTLQILPHPRLSHLSYFSPIIPPIISVPLLPFFLFATLSTVTPLCYIPL